MLMVSFSATCWTVCVSFLNVLRVDPLYYLKNSILHCIHVACSFKSGHLAVFVIVISRVLPCCC